MAKPTADDEEHEQDNTSKCHPPHFLTKLSYASHIYVLKGFLTSIYKLRNLAEHIYPPVGAPDIVKTYECRPNLPIR